jgi:glycosyltransferase involved in cell wall biosynthesis
VKERNRRILYIQYGDPELYPPIERSAKLLSRGGWSVLVLGIQASEPHRIRFESVPGILLKKISACKPGWRQKMHYFLFCLWIYGWALCFRPAWIYVSDYLACPAVLPLLFWLKPGFIYHEHDMPLRKNRGMENILLSGRKILAGRARLILLPNEERRGFFISEMGVASEKVYCSWNSPLLEELDIAVPKENGVFYAVYHGSITPPRLPVSVIGALTFLPEAVRLRIIGYETIGYRGYVSFLLKEAERQGVAHRVEYLGTVPTRSQLLGVLSECRVGLMLLEEEGEDPNRRWMLGASNKVFDYLTSGLAVLVPDSERWKRVFIDRGVGRFCRPSSPEGIARALEWFFKHPEETRRMGMRGRDCIQTEWNYENQYASVLNVLNPVAELAVAK